MSDIQILEIPKWGLSMEEGTLVAWHISEGDSFSEGDDLCDIETSKITNVYEAPFSGVLRKKIAELGVTLPVKAPIGLVADMSVTDEEVERFLAGLGGAADDVNNTDEVEAVDPKPSSVDVEQKSETTQHAPGADNIPDILLSGQDDADVFATLHARKFAKKLGINLHNVSGSGRRNRISKKDVIEAIQEKGGQWEGAWEAEAKAIGPAHEKAKKIKATPIAKRLAEKLGVDLNACPTESSHGRIGKADVERAHKAAQNKTTTLPALIDNISGSAGTELSQMRKVIATRLQQSKQEAPHFRLVIECEIDKLLAARKLINDNFPNVKISINDMLVKACAEALVKNPECNVQFDGQTLFRFEDVDISIAVALEGGVITPKITKANKKGLSQISTEAADLIVRAKEGRLSPDEYQGGTFTISNLGMFGIKNFDAVINPPQCAILAVGVGEKRSIVRNDEAVIATMMTLTLASDHRVIDGATGAKFLQSLKALIENPSLMMI